MLLTDMNLLFMFLLVEVDRVVYHLLLSKAWFQIKLLLAHRGFGACWALQTYPSPAVNGMSDMRCRLHTAGGQLVRVTLTT
jgi:hypothetical protein